MTTTYKISVVAAALAILAIALTAYIVGLQQKMAFGSAPKGIAATVATTSNPTVGTTAALIFATSSTCTARTVTTVASPVMITFSDSQGKVPTALFGHLQPASTTVVYDSGQVGCDAWRMYGFVSSAVTVSESR
jgi:hypothetical protein